MLIDGEELIKELVKGKRLFEEITVPEGFDFSPYIPTINEVLRKFPYKTEPLTINGGQFIRINAEGIFLRSLNAAWEPEKPLSFVGSNLKNADLREANLQHADFSNADLTMANLQGVNLENATLQRANLTKAKLNNANLSNADLSTANLEETNLTDSDLCGAGLANTNLHKANLTGVEFFTTDLRDADLSNADLTCSCGSGDFTDANLSEAVLKEVEYNHSIFTRARFEKVKGDKSSFYKTDFSNAFFEHASLQYIYAEHIDFCRANLKNVNFHGSELKKVDFTDADLSGADFDQVTLDGAYFCRTNLVDAKNIDTVKGFENTIFINTVVTSEQKKFIEKKIEGSSTKRFIVKEE
ncbi:MAG TPA: pentapeptide repeat-containing protein [Thermoplasmata archaeon]|nr:pentapeptide repeat-containing protein [Thermoplasmata archaeon]